MSKFDHGKWWPRFLVGAGLAGWILVALITFLTGCVTVVEIPGAVEDQTYKVEDLSAAYEVCEEEEGAPNFIILDRLDDSTYLIDCKDSVVIDADELPVR